MRGCKVLIHEHPRLRKPVLIEGLPGIGFVANILALHLISELKASKFCDIRSPFFQDLAVTGQGGNLRFPINSLYYARTGDEALGDLLILYGNTQALSPFGQYELYSEVIEIVEKLGCKLVICIGGLPVERVLEKPRVYCTATNINHVKGFEKQGVEVIRGRVYGAAGVLMGLGKLKGIEGCCLLAETPGTYPDAQAARVVLDVMCRFLHLNVNPERLAQAAQLAEKTLSVMALKTRERPQPMGLI